MSCSSDKPCESTRRAFCLSAAAIALTGCANKRAGDSADEPDTGGVGGDTADATDTSEAGAEPSTEVFLSYIDYPQLQTLMGWAVIYNSTGVEVMVLRAEDGARALLGICTHEGCPTAFNADVNKHICPCHGGVFSLDGEVVAGPPPASMSPRSTRETDIGVFVDLEDWF